jgi:hypothetical protein
MTLFAMWLNVQKTKKEKSKSLKQRSPLSLLQKVYLWKGSLALMGASAIQRILTEKEV